MTTNIQDAVADLEWLASPAAETLTDGTRITEFCKAVHKLDLTQLVKEVEAGERGRIEEEVFTPLYEEIQGWYVQKHDVVGQGALVHVFQKALEALIPPASDVTEK